MLFNTEPIKKTNAMKFFTNNSKVGKFAGNLSIVAVMVLLVTSLLGISQKLNLLPDNLSSMQTLETVKEKIAQTFKKNNTSTALMAPCPGLNLQCVDRVNLSLDAMCMGSIQADMLFSAPTGLPQDTFIYKIEEPGGAIRTNNAFTSVDLGKTFKVTVSVKGCDTPPCWSNVLIEDKTKPVIDCPRDTIDCFELLDAIKPVTVTDNCSGVVKQLVSSIYTSYRCDEPNGLDYLGFYTRKYRAVDTYKNDTMCDQIVLVRRPNFTDLRFPQAITLACQVIAANDAGIPSPKASGWPTLNGAVVTPASNTLCMADLSYKDSVITPAIVCRKVIKRDWELIQWTCGAPLIRRGSQFITVIDTVAPTIVNLPNMILNVTSSKCEVTVALPRITATDNCQADSSLRYEITHPRGTIFTNGGNVSLPAGVHFVYYKVTDGTCGNSSYDTIRLDLIDKVAPVAVCQHDPIVSISNNGIGYISASALNNNSYDACGGPVTIKVRRMEKGCGNDSMWVDSVKYCCADVNNPDLMIALQVTDANGNTNICMSNIKIQNKIVPDAVFPQDTTVKCSFAFALSNLGSVFGQPRIIGTECTNSGSFRDTFEVIRDMCGIGQIIRTMTLVHNGKDVKTGVQIITIEQDSIFNPASIKWPEAEVYVTGSIDTSITGSPRIPFVPCNMIGVNVTTDTFPMNTNGTCAKYYRTWKVINWCGRSPGSVIATFTQTIILEDKKAPVINLPVPDITVCSFADNCGAKELAVITVTATDNNTPISGLIWTYDIDLFNNGSVDTTGNGNTMRYLSVLGKHKVTFTVRDGCGNASSTSVFFDVKNCKPPTAKCKSGIIVLMKDPDGDGPLGEMVEICAKDFNAGSEDLCTDSTLLKYTFDMWYPVISSINVDHYFKGDGVPATLDEYNAGLAQKWVAARKTSCKVLTCADSPSRVLTITVWDLDRNKGICQPTIMVMGMTCCTDVTPPVISTVRDTVRINLNNPALPCSTKTQIVIGANATDDRTPLNGLKWSFKVDLDNNGSIDTSGVDNNTPYVICLGTHKINLYVEDSCRNADTLSYIVIVKNVTPPTARCVTNPLAVTLIDFDGDGPMLPMYFLRADTLNNASTPSSDPCTPANKLIYTFSGAYPIIDLIDEIHWFTNTGLISTQAEYLAGRAQQWNPTTRTSTFKLQCGDRGTRSFTMTVWDEDRNSSSCTVTVNIAGPCPCNDVTLPVITTSDTLRLICSNSLVCSTRTNVLLSATATDNVPNNLLKWTFDIDLNNNGSVDTSGTSNSVNYLAPLGTHKVTFIVSDTCDNRDTLVYLFNVKNCVPPTCTTRNFTVTPVIDPNSSSPAMVELRADSLVTSSFDPCTPRDSLVLTFGATYPVRATFKTVHFFKGNGLPASQAEFDAGTAQRWQPTVRASVIKISCANGPNQNLVVTVTDQDGRTSTCTSIVTVVCPQGLCVDNAYTGFMVATCNSESRRPGFNDPVVVLYDVKQNQTANRDLNWNRSPFYASNWYIDSIGQVFGIAIDDSANVYLAGTDVYLIKNNQPAGISTGNIYMSRPPLFKAERIVTLPNFGDPFNGIGNIAYNRVHNTLFASNLEDGKIYRINPFTRTILDSYDPWTADLGGVNGIVTQNEQVWGLGVNYEAGGVVKLYFARLGSNGRQMYSVTLSASGSFPAAGSEVIEIANLPGDEIRITDIAFSSNGRKMLWAERGGTVKVDFVNGAPSPPIIDGSHSNIVAEYLKPAATWTFAKEYKVGSNVKQEYGDGTDPSIPNSIQFGQNSAGGVDYGFEQNSPTNPFTGIDSMIWATGNWLHKGVQFQNNVPDDSLYYGIQGISSGTIGNVKNDIVVDFDNSGRSFPDKGLVGDVEIFRCRYNPAFQNNLMANVTGEIYTRNNEVLEGATVRLLDQATMQTTTNADGRFEFKEVVGGAEYIVKPTKNDDAINGVDAIDMLRLQKHMLSIKKFDNAYDYIAADVDGDKKITVSDLVDMRKVILGVKETFAVNQSWKMIDANTTFSDITNPWKQPLAEEYYISKLDEDMWIDFKAIKLGDLDGSAIANKASTKTRSNGKLELTKGLPIQKDGKTLLPIYGENADLSAMHLKFTGLTTGTEVVSGTLNIETANVFTSGKDLQMIYTNPKSELANLSQPLFYLAAKNGTYDEVRLASGTAYLGDELPKQLELRDQKGTVGTESSMVLNQNQPNPWSAQTSISYELPRAGKVSIAIYNIAGKQVFLKVIDAQKGVNELTINAVDMPTTGVYHYTLQFENQLLNKRLIHIAK